LLVYDRHGQFCAVLMSSGLGLGLEVPRGQVFAVLVSEGPVLFLVLTKRSCSGLDFKLNFSKPIKVCWINRELNCQLIVTLITSQVTWLLVIVSCSHSYTSHYTRGDSCLVLSCKSNRPSSNNNVICHSCMVRSHKQSTAAEHMLHRSRGDFWRQNKPFQITHSAVNISGWHVPYSTVFLAW